ncbi:MAG: hypothetical protein ACTSYL_00345 [Candidatus Thorarchaeota archaeon]
MPFAHTITSRMYWIVLIALTFLVPILGIIIAFPFLYMLIPRLREYLLSFSWYELVAIIAFMSFLWFVSGYLLRVWIRMLSKNTVQGPIELIKIKRVPTVFFVAKWINITVGEGTYRMIEQGNLSQHLQEGMKVSLRVDANSMISRIKW